MHTMRRNVPSRPALRLPPLAALALSLIAGMAPQSALADADITFKGTLIEQPPCEITSTTGGAIEVDFGSEMVTRRVDGVNYRQKIPFLLDCSNAVDQKLQLTLTGDPGYAAGLIKTTKETELGIRLYHNTVQMTPGTPLNFSPDSIPELYAVPEAKDNTTLAGGDFTGKANLIVDYQ
jgi:type 1 fimbria pilin